MISFHRNTADFGRADRYRDGWLPANIDDVSRIALGISRFPWSNIQWWEGVRKQSNFGRAQFIALDFDDGATTLEQALKLFCDAVHIIGTTKSHRIAKGGGAPCDRFRVLLKLESPVSDLATYRATAAHYIDKFASDPACSDGARFYWPCREIVSINPDGYTQDIHDPEPHGTARDYRIYRENKVIPTWVAGYLKFGAHLHTRNSTCLKIGKYLYLCGYSESEILELIRRSPIDLDDKELKRVVKNGVTYGRMELNGEES